MNYLPTCTFSLVVQHLYQVSFKSMQGCRRSWEDKLWCDGMTEGRTKQTLNTPLPFYGGGIKIQCSISMLTEYPFCAEMCSDTVSSALTVAPPLPTLLRGSSTVRRRTSLSIRPLACRFFNSIKQCIVINKRVLL